MAPSPKTASRAQKRKDGAQLEALTVRMDARLKFGLELLARDQGRSISQALEWALQSALMKAHVGALKMTIWDLLPIAWESEGWLRWFTVYKGNPALVPFEERHACELVANSPEMAFLASAGEPGLQRKWEEVIEAYWPRLLEDSVAQGYSSDGKRPLLVEVASAADADIPTIIDEVYSRIAERL